MSLQNPVKHISRCAPTRSRAGGGSARLRADRSGDGGGGVRQRAGDGEFAGVDGGGVDHDVHRARLGLGVKHHGAGGLAKAAELGGITKMRIRKTREGV